MPTARLKQSEDARHGGGPASAAARRVSKGDVLRAARVLFARQGYQQTTTRQIAAEAGLKSGSIYHHFRTKEEILHAILDPFVISSPPIFERIVHSGGGVLATFEAMIEQSLRFPMDDPHVAQILITERRTLSRLPEFKYIEDYWSRIRHLWRQLLEEGGRSGIFRTDLDVEIVVHTITALVASLARDQMDDAGPAQRLIEVQKAILIRGLSVVRTFGADRGVD